MAVLVDKVRIILVGQKNRVRQIANAVETMRGGWTIVAAGIASLVMSGCTETMGTQANSQNRSAASNLCVSAVSRRTGNSNVSVVRTESRQRRISVWVSVGSTRSQWKCSVDHNGPGSFFIRSIHRV